MTPSEMQMARLYWQAFRANNDTKQIARNFHVAEHSVYNLMHRFREAQRNLPFDAPLRNAGAFE